MNYKHLCLLFINGIILGVYLLFSYQSSYAQTPTPTAQPLQAPTENPVPPSPTPLLTSTVVSTNDNLIITSPFSASTPAPPSQSAGRGDLQVLNVTLAELGYKDITIAGPRGKTEFSLRLPSYWTMLPGNSLTLHYLPQIGLNDTIEPFELQVIFDDKIIHRSILNTLDEQFLNIPLPDLRPKQPGNDYKLQILLDSSAECKAGVYGFLNIFSDSSFNLNYQVAPPLLDLAYYPSPIYERTFFTQTAVIVLPEQPDPLPVEGALSLGARLGQLTDNNFALTTTTASALDPTNLPDEHLVIIGTPENNSLISSLNKTLQLPVSLQQRRLQLAGVGPDLVIPGDLFTYTLYITNSETTTASNLSVDIQVPQVAERVGCQPGCQRSNNTLRWDIGTLQPGTASSITLSLAYPLTAAVEAATLPFELAQDQNIINTITLDSPIASEGNPGITRTISPSPFFFVLEDRAVRETDGVIQLIPSPQQPNKAILLVTGLTNEAVYKAARALGIQSDLLGMTGQVALVQTIFEEAEFESEPLESFTLADLGYEDRLLIGTSSQDAERSYYFRVPLNWSLKPRLI